jgi:hypothetical protein
MQQRCSVGCSDVSPVTERRQFNFLKNVGSERVFTLAFYVLEKRKIFNADLKLIKMLKRKNAFDQILLTSKKK